MRVPRFPLAPAAFLAAAALAAPAPPPPPSAGSPLAAPDSALAPPLDVEGDRLEGMRTPEGDRVILTGSVLMRQGGLTARAARGEYDKARDVVLLLDGVVLEDSSTTLEAREVRYERAGSRAWARGDVVLRDGRAEVSGAEGAFQRTTGVGEIWGGAVYREGSRRVEARRIRFDREAGTVRAESSVVVRDEEGEIQSHGERGDFRRDTGAGWLAGDARLRELEGSDAAPFLVTADTLWSFEREDRALATGGAVFRQGETEARADTMRFDRASGWTEMRGGPVLLEGENLVRGVEIDLHTVEGEVDSIAVRGEASARYRAPDSLGGGGVPPSEVWGDRMAIQVRGGALSRVEVTGSARSVYHPPAGGGRAGEWNESRGDSMDLYFEDRALARVVVRGRATGSHHFPPEPAAPGDTLAAEERSEYAGERIDYDVAAEHIRIRREAQVEFGLLRLKAGEIGFNPVTERLGAQDRPILWDGAQKILGTQMTYSLGTARGSIFAGRLRYEKGYYRGSVIRKVSEGVLNVDQGTYTSCDLGDPHYAFTSRRMKIYADDRVIAKPLVMRLRGVPVLALPFFMFPIAGDRRSGLLIPEFEFGFSGRQGRFIRHLGYYWAPNDYWDLKGWGDYFERDRWVGYLQGRYKMIYRMEGNFEGSYNREFGSGDRRYDVSANHQQTLGENTGLTARANFVSDRTYRQDIIRGPQERLNRELRSDVAVSRRWDGGSLNLAADRTENLDTETVTRTLPSASFSLTRRQLVARGAGSDASERWYHRLYWDASGSGTNRESKQAALDQTNHSVQLATQLNGQSLPASPSLRYRTRWDEDLRRPASGPATTASASDHLFTLNSAPRFGGWLELGPTVQWQFTRFSRDLEGNPDAWRRTWEAQGNARTNFYGTFFPEWGSLVGVRHVMSPSLVFTYRPEFPQYYLAGSDPPRTRFPSVGGISGGAPQAQRTLGIGLGNNLHLKVRRGDQVQKLNNVASLRLDTAYDFLWKENLRDDPWNDLRSALTIQPPYGFDLRLSTTHALPEVRLDQLNLNVSYRVAGSAPQPAPPAAADSASPAPDSLEGEYALDPLPRLPSPAQRPWSLTLSHRFDHRRGADDNYWLDGALEFSPASHWRVAYSARANLRERDLISQRINLYRDLHCWEFHFTREFSNEDWRYYFRINIKAHPEIYHERGERGLG